MTKFDQGHFREFMSIRGLNNVVKEIVALNPFPNRPTVFYRGKIKLHGTNGGVRVYGDGAVVAQKRTSDLGPTEDNYGFRQFVETHRGYFSNLGFLQGLKPDEFMTIYGEWAGPGIQKNVGVSKLAEKQFFVFMIDLPNDVRVYEPQMLEAVMDFSARPARVHILPWWTNEINMIDFNSKEATEEVAARWNDRVAEIDKLDPYIKRVEGVGEGLVFYPVMIKGVAGERAPHPVHELPALMIKVKGASHGEKGAAKPARVTAGHSQSALLFAQTHTHEARLTQGLQAIFGESAPVIEKMGPFLGWVGRDVQKETADELEASGLVWKDVAGPVALIAREWLFKKLDGSPGAYYSPAETVAAE